MRRAVTTVIALGLAWGMVYLFNTRMRNNVWRAYPLVMKADLRNLAAAEEAYFDRTGQFTVVMDSLAGFSTSTGVTVVPTVTAGTLEARATHTAIRSGKGCTIAVHGTPGQRASHDPVRCDGFTNWLGLPRLN